MNRCRPPKERGWLTREVNQPLAPSLVSRDKRGVFYCAVVAILTARSATFLSQCNVTWTLILLRK